MRNAKFARGAVAVLMSAMMMLSGIMAIAEDMIQNNVTEPEGKAVLSEQVALPEIVPPEQTEEKEPKTFFIKFLDAEGAVYYTKIVEENEAVRLPSGLKIEKEGYKFVCWLNLDIKDTEDKRFTFGQTTDRSIVLTPKMVKVNEEVVPEEVEPEEIVPEEVIPEEVEPEEVAPEEVIPEEVEPEEIVPEEVIPEEVEPEEIVPDEVEPEEVIPDEAAPESARSITIGTTATGEVKAGDAITLFAVITGFEDVEYTYVWQYNSGGEWKDAQTGGTTMSFVLTDSNFSWDWRIKLTVTQPTGAE